MRTYARIIRAVLLVAAHRGVLRDLTDVVSQFSDVRDSQLAQFGAGRSPAPWRCGIAMCQHFPRCPSAEAPDRVAARAVSRHPEQGWSLLCNGVVLFDDSGEILPSGRVIAPRQWGQELYQLPKAS